MKSWGKVIVALGALALVCLSWGAPSSAQDYTGVISTTLTSPTMRACSDSTNTARATGFQPGAEVTFTLVLPSGPVELGEDRASGGRATADAQGVATITFSLPAGTEPGTYDLVTTGTSSAGVADRHVIRLTVTECSDPGTSGTTTPGGSSTGSDDLARTGSSLTGAVRLGVLVLAAGAVLVLVTRRRSSRPA